MSLENSLGITRDGHTQRLTRQVKLQLLANGLADLDHPDDGPLTDRNGSTGAIADSIGIVEQLRVRNRLLADQRCPVDQRIESFLASYFADAPLPYKLQLPDQTVVLHRHGLARELSLPERGDQHTSELLTSYRVRNGVLHNPRSDRRTTQGTFHVTDGGLPIPGDKLEVPRKVFAEMFRQAMNPPAKYLKIPFTSDSAQPALSFVSLLIRPIVYPEVPGVSPEKTMEVRFFVPGSLVSNLDFVESIFGNGGDPFLPANDAGLDVEHWTGHTGCVILAPHLTQLTKKQLGLPHYDSASERARRDGMCWKEPGELYNGGNGFKLTCRNRQGVIVTLIADNYYGYCKKEVKTQISYAANLSGNVEEEHAGGAVAFTSYNFGDEYQFDSRKVNGRSFADVVRDYGAWMDVMPEGCAIDRAYPSIIYIPEESRASARRQQVWWTDSSGKEQSIPMMPGMVYITPSGFKLILEKHPGAPSWRIIGTRGEGTVCHKPCTVSGGGKSEISKSLRDYMIYGPIFVADFDKDMKIVRQVFEYDYSKRWGKTSSVNPDYSKNGSRPILGPERSLGSVIKLLTPSKDYSDEYNAWLESVPSYIWPIVFIIKRFYRPEWGDDWQKNFSVDTVNGFPGHELKFNNRTLVGTYLRLGLESDNSWRTFKLRQDFAAAKKIQTEDDISASIVHPAAQLPPMRAGSDAMSYKFSVNCESRLFQRPDDAIHRGLDKQTEADFSREDNFFSNYEPLPATQARDLVLKVTEFEAFTPPMKQMLSKISEERKGFVVCSANPRIIDGKPSKNPRYLQIRPDLLDPASKYIAEMGVRLYRAIPANQPVLMPVDAVLVGRRNNPEDKPGKIRGLAVYNPIHYQQLPELFMDFICSLTGKSPSTTGAGSEGALTKAPFNAVRPTADLNAALVSYILTGLGGFSTSAGYVGPQFRVDHDISLLVPEIWCRLEPKERDPRFLIDNGFFELVEDFEHKGEKILASRLGYRMTPKFVRAFFGRVFDNPARVFDQLILRPELQDLEAFADGIKNITEAQQRVGRSYFEDNSIEEACPPLKALLTIMAEGAYQGKDVHHPEIRAMFTRENLLGSPWYQQRLAARQRADVALWKRHMAYLDGYLARPSHSQEAQRLDIPRRRDMAERELKRASAKEYVQALVGTLGTDPTLVPAESK